MAEEPRATVPWRPRTPLEWLDRWLCGRGRYPRGELALIYADATELLDRLGGGAALAEAERCAGCLDPSRTERHWHRVGNMLAEHLGRPDRVRRRERDVFGLGYRRSSHPGWPSGGNEHLPPADVALSGHADAAARLNGRLSRPVPLA